MRKFLMSAAVLALLGGCNASGMKGDYAGLYTGPEGTYLAIEALDDGTFYLEMRWGLDENMLGNFDGTSVEGGIQFLRDGEKLVLKPVNGDATGMKWLAGKSNCLMVKVGEGYCKD